MPEIIAPEIAPEPEQEPEQETCCHCKHKIDEGYEIEHDGSIYCGDCLSVCDECSEHFLSDDILSAGDYIFCSEHCANERGFNRCIDCGDYVRDVYYVSGRGDVCLTCVDEYTCCEDCGEYFSNCSFHEGSSMWYCSDCFPEDNRIIHDYSFSPELLFKKLAFENTLYIGIELELECPDGEDNKEMTEVLSNWLMRQRTKDQQHILTELIWFKHDGSLENGVEMCFHPMTLKYLHAEVPLVKIFKKIVNLGFRSFESGRCGLHVHISKSGVKAGLSKTRHSRDIDYAGKLFFYLCERQLKKFSRRTSFHYCQFDNNMPKRHDLQPFGRYSALNIGSEWGTYELRLFRGTLHYKRILASLQFSDAFGNYIQNHSAGYLKHLTSEQAWFSFISYCKRDGNYSQMLKYFSKNKIV